LAGEVRRTGSAIFFGFNTLAIVPHRAGPGPTPATIGLIALVICIPVLASGVVVLLAGWSRAWLRQRRISLRELQAAVRLETRSRALMSELCPHGWRAQITMFGESDELPPGAPKDRRARVALDWAEIEDETGDVAVVRRVWAASVAEALEAMVADRRMDETLEQIERGARWSTP
jgi:hypothetical protein